VHCCSGSGAVMSDREWRRRSGRSCVEGLQSGTSGHNQTEELKEGEACGGFPHPSLIHCKRRMNLGIKVGWGEYKLIVWGIKYKVLLPSYIAFRVPPFSCCPRGSCSAD
jgi:hypothetical protein